LIGIGGADTRGILGREKIGCHIIWKRLRRSEILSPFTVKERARGLWEKKSESNQIIRKKKEKPKKMWKKKLQRKN